MTGATRIFVVVPAFREAPHIGRVIRTMPDIVDHIIVVDDASDDGTADEARACNDARVIVRRHERNRGVGAAIATGYRTALGMPGGPRDAFVVMAGDGQMDPRDLPALVAPVARGDAGYVKGDRFSDPRKIPRARYLGGQLTSWLTRRAVGIPVSDAQCGYTALSREACATLDLNELWPRFGYPNDLLAKVTASGWSVAEIRVRPVYGPRANKLRARHVVVIIGVIVRAWARRYRLTRLRRT